MSAPALPIMNLSPPPNVSLTCCSPIPSFCLTDRGNDNEKHIMQRSRSERPGAVDEGFVAPARPAIDMDYVLDLLEKLLKIPSPTGYTDEVVHFCGRELKRLGIPFELTRRGAIRADIKGRLNSPDRAIVAHVDTLGAQVKGLKPNGRLELVAIGTWSARFAEGARCTIFTDHGSYRGTILPLKASGHTFNEAVDTQPVGWMNVEVRVDAVAYKAEDLKRLGFNVGESVALDPTSEVSSCGYISSCYLDDKAGVAVLFAAMK